MQSRSMVYVGYPETVQNKRLVPFTTIGQLGNCSHYVGFGQANCGEACVVCLPKLTCELAKTTEVVLLA